MNRNTPYEYMNVPFYGIDTESFKISGTNYEVKYMIEGYEVPLPQEDEIEVVS